MNFHKMNCTKLRNFLESKRVEWLVDNVSLADVIVIEKRLHDCSREVYRRMQNILGFMRQNIARREAK